MKAILSIDGGGIRGIIPARVLAKLEEIAGQPCSKLFDLLAGTSTGGILALGLVTHPIGMGGGPGYMAATLVDMYRKNGQRIFSRPPAWELETALGVGGPKYPADGLETVLSQYFADVKLSEACTPVMVTTYDTAEPGPMLVRSWQYPDGPPLMRDAARATSAAPTYFPPYVEDENILIDGGVFANNPAMCAWALAKAELFDKDEELVVVSLGTGNTEKKEDPQGWGLAKWAPSLIDIFMDGNSDVVDLQMRTLLSGIRYFRFQTDLPGVSQAMDDASPATIAALIDLADEMILKERATLELLADRLKSRAE